MSIVLPGGPAFAAEAWGGAISATSDYIYRGVSQSGGAPAAQADLHVRSNGGWFAGAWTSTADPPPGNVASYEVDLYAGHTWEITSAWSGSLTYHRYMYPNSVVHRQYDSHELQVSVGFEDRLAVTVSYSPNAIQYSSYGWSTRARETAYELSLRQPVIAPVAIVAGLGYYDTAALFGDSFVAWNAGLAANVGPFEFSVTRFATDSTGRRLFGRFVADHWAVTATARF